MMPTHDFWIRLPLAALIIICVYSMFAKGMLLGSLGDWLEERFDEWYLKPIFLCPVCMPSVYGTTIWFATGGDVSWWPVFVLALSGLMRLIADQILK